MQELKKFIKQMQSTSSSLEKIQILKNQPELIQKILEYTYNPYKQYYVTSETCKKNPNLISYEGLTPLFILLDKLTTREITGHSAIQLVNKYAQYGEDFDLIYDIIDKDLKIRTGVKIINKAFPNLIPEFNVALAQEYKGDINFNRDDFFLSRKLDGVRCVAIINSGGECTLYSRQGNEFLTLNKVKNTLESLNLSNIVFDGELCLTDDEGNEDFQGIMKQIRRKNHTIPNPKFLIFDQLTLNEFNEKEKSLILEKRLDRLKSIITPNNILKILPQIKIKSQNEFEEWVDKSNRQNWEGLMLRKNIAYEGKRTKNLQKVKKFYDAEYKIIRQENSIMSVVRDGKESQEEMLAHIWINHKGYEVKVGSGFTQEQRIKYKNKSLEGQTITIQYFEETFNEKGGISLRFPTVKFIHGDRREY